ncbi:MAG: tyrosine-type recombinase/integrase [Chloroflexi bacterium]|nr:tyrosine-type recombinase/integrase [Chloroflexota bacterium]
MTRAYLEPNEVARLEAAATNVRDRLLIRLLFHTGCRISEALALTLGDIDFDNATIRIIHLKIRLRLSCPHCGTRLGRSHAYCPKCGERVLEAVAKALEHRRQRTLPIDGKTLAILKDYIRRGGYVERKDRNLIFGVNRHRAWQIVKECSKKARLPHLVNPETGRERGISPHRLRDAFAVNAMKVDDTGDGLRLLQEQLGHASFNTTAKYRKVAGEELKEWYQKLWKEKPSG